ncbi:DUF47 family protein [Candidatus Bipolaricaulota bacterium]|nr:DUF47 family protein [Candidatus Bipolaricaulota bacterium]
MGLWDSEARVEELVEDHIEYVEKVFSRFGEGMKIWLEDGDIEEAKELAGEIRKLEGSADDVRREIEKELIGGALLAHSREEIMELINGVDKLANAGEASMNFAALQEIEIPEDLKPLVIDIVDRTMEIMDDVHKGVVGLMEGKEDEAREATKAIEIGEGDVDDIELNFIRRLFATELDLAEKVQLRQYLETLVEISDRAEDLSDRLDTILAIRRA